MTLTPDQVNKLTTGLITLLGIAIPVFVAWIKNGLEERKLARARLAAEIKETEAAANMAIFVTAKAQAADQNILELETQVGILKKDLENARSAESGYIASIATVKVDLAAAAREIEILHSQIKALPQPPPFSYSDLVNDGPQTAPPVVPPEP